MDNIKLENGSAIITLNPKIYQLEVIYSAAYVFLDRVYILLDGDPEKSIIVSIKPKTKEDAKTLAMEFTNELINYADYKSRSEDTKHLREILLTRALITNDPAIAEQEEIIEDDDDYIEDPEGIAIPWEDKYGKLDKGNKNED
jgi:His-Xaa-Ser system protein HxsD